MAKWGITKQKAKVAQFLDKHVQGNCKTKFVDAHKGRSKAAGIKSKCQECFGFQNVVREIRYCKGWTCPLWPYRPYQVEGDPMGAVEKDVAEDATS